MQRNETSQGRTVLVTGAGTGIGRATAWAFGVRTIRHLLAAGLTLEDIRVFLPCLDGGVAAAAPSARGLQVTRARLAVLEERIAAQVEVRDRLAEALRRAAG